MPLPKRINMKKPLLLLCLSFSFCNLIAQQILNLKPGSAEGKDATLISLFPNEPSGDLESNTIYTWTGLGNIVFKHTLIQFDLAQIPENAVITSALLSLYYNPTDPYESFSVHTGDNDLRIRRVTSSWQEHAVTWNTKPAVTAVNEVIVPESTSSTQDYLDIEVLPLITDIVSLGEGNHGLALSMVNEQNPYRALLFASSDHPNASLHPELTVYWEMPDLDNDGYLADVDCDDENAGINPSAMEIPNNGIDEDCDGADLISSTAFVAKHDIRIYPNPASKHLVVEWDGYSQQEMAIRFYNIAGLSLLSLQQVNTKTTLDVEHLSPGIYFLEIRDLRTGESGVQKVVVE